MAISYRAEGAPAGHRAVRGSEPEWLAFTAKLTADLSRRRGVRS
jgi:hypothetical protein